ncbi:ATP-binding protein [Piscinibacter sakaiensis]|uniref:histidine kinase n=1 Tax=Piscinibacter sakaiensis TaxID=1547922 RepID=A0A0K8P6B7_PISS1|nr:ATP-binding protein [Piscinibacter sakaiensis]GAP38074.1 hypothetical protein ISF6_4268 [Piscinibacter sakaiensis]
MVPSLTLPPASHPVPPQPATDGDPGASAVARRLSGWIALAVCLLAGLWLAVVALVEQDRQNTRRQALQSLANLSRAFAEHTTKSLEGADQAVRFVRSEYLQHHAALDLPAYLQSRSIIDDDYHLLTVIGPDGLVVASTQPFTRVDLREREHFRVHAEGREDRLYVSRPVLGKVSGKWSIQITRRIDEPDGRFGGVVVVSMPPSYFSSFYRDVDLGPTGTTALLGLDGVVRARASAEGEQQGMDVRDSRLFEVVRASRHGTLEAVSRLDGVKRFYAFRRLEKHDLAVVVGVGVDDAMAEFRERTQVLVALAGAASLLLTGLAFALLRRVHRQDGLMRALRASEVQAQSASRMKSRLLASVSHELRTPLNGILGYAELIRDTSQDPQSAEFGAIVHESARHLHTLVNQILDLAKIESGRLRARVEPTPLRPLFEEVQRLHAVHAQARGIAWSLQIDPACPPTLPTDRTRLLQVLTNVVNNAIKFTDRGGVSVHVAPQAGGLGITVRDSGIGIAEDRLPLLFARFQGVGDDVIHANQGAGLGLPLAKELTELLGGRLAVRSRLGQGTEVDIWLPLPAVAAPAAEPAGPAASSNTDTP